MRKLQACLLGAALAVGIAGPASAAWNKVGEIDVSSRNYGRDTRFVNLGGSVEALQLRASRNTVECASVRATFGNGRTREIFSGTLLEGRAVGIDLPGRERNIRRLDFDCRADRGRNAMVEVVADVGRYRDEWRRSPDWERNWSRIFNWGSDMANNWVLLGNERFQGRRDNESVFADWRGRRVDTLALMPVEADARCRSVTAQFGNGRTQPLAIRGGDVLRRGVYNAVDLPGGYRDIKRLNLRCQAVGAREVTIRIFTSK